MLDLLRDALSDWREGGGGVRSIGPDGPFLARARTAFVRKVTLSQAAGMSNQPADLCWLAFIGRFDTPNLSMGKRAGRISSAGPFRPEQ
jgi:hypothetical protein